MALRRKTMARASRKRTAKRTARKNRRKNVGFKVQRSLGTGFPKQLTMTHRYCETLSFVVGPSSYSTYNFVANGMYDPNSSGTGHQPYYFDQMASLYNHYTVIGSKVRVTFNNLQDNTNNTIAAPLLAGCFSNDNTTITPTTIYEFQELGGKRSYKIIGQDGTPVGVNKTFSAKKVFGGSVLGNVNLQGNSGANPSETQVYTFWLGNTATATTGYATANIDVEYIAVWRELKDIAGS